VLLYRFSKSQGKLYAIFHLSVEHRNYWNFNEECEYAIEVMSAIFHQSDYTYKCT